MDAARLAECQIAVGYTFRNEALLKKALTHSSSKTPERPSNERLEFLGDAVLGMIVSDDLYQMLPDSNEGQLTKIKSVVVSSKTLVRCSKALQLPRFMDVGKGVQIGRRLPDSLLANTFEAVAGAIYLDGGLEAARGFVARMLAEHVARVITNKYSRNYKSLLQHFAQKEFADTPTYRVIREEGPDHYKSFQIVAVVQGVEYGPANGKNKKEAEQRAARRALMILRRQKLLALPSRPAPAPEAAPADLAETDGQAVASGEARS